MVTSIATVTITKDTILPLRIFINRKQIIQNTSNKTVFEAPLLSNNSMVSLKSRNTGIYLSSNDMRNLCKDIKEDLLLILYDLTSPVISQNVLAKLRIGQTMDFQTAVVQRLQDQLAQSDSSFINSNILTITRLTKFQYKLHYELNWKLDIFIENIRKLASIRQYLVFKNDYNSNELGLGFTNRRRVLVMEQSSVQIPHILLDDEINQIIESIPEQVEDLKPEVNFKYKPVLSLGQVIDIHILERPRRHKKGDTN